MQVQLTRKGGDVDAHAVILSPERREQVEMVVHGPQEYLQEDILQQVSPGRYRGEFALEQVGDYVVTFRLKKAGRLVDSITRKIHLDYSPEHALSTGDGQAILQTLVGVTGGRFIAGNEEIFSEPLRKEHTIVNLDFILLPLALVLFLLDIAVRKLDWFSK